MARLFIPAIGDRLTVVKPWYFKLYLEHRNTVFAKANGHTLPHTGWNVYMPNSNQLAYVDHIIEVGTVLECDRIYIKATSKSAATPEDSYDSLTWKVVVNGKAARNQRFWVKLSECSNLEFDESSISKYIDRK